MVSELLKEILAADRHSTVAHAQPEVERDELERPLVRVSLFMPRSELGADLL